MKHVHAEFIAEAILDLSKVIMQKSDHGWVRSSLASVISADSSSCFCFKESLIGSTLSDETLELIQQTAMNRCPNTMSAWIVGRRAIADAAAAQMYNELL